jgi:hypothetical protein
LDRKEVALLAELRRRIAIGTFDELDVHSLLALLREYTNKKDPLHELGDFVAHRERDRGAFHQYLSATKQAIDASGTRIIKIAEIYSEREIAESLNSAFSAQNLPPLDARQNRAVQLAAMCMLEDAAMVNDQGSTFGQLRVVFTRAQVQLLGEVDVGYMGARVAFPALSIQNDFFPMLGPNAYIRPSELIQVRFVAGSAHLSGIKPYELHVARKRERDKAEPRPIDWSEVLEAITGIPLIAVRHDDREFEVGAGQSVVRFRLSDGRLTFPWLTEYDLPTQDVLRLALLLKQRLAARLFDDTGGYFGETPQSIASLSPE